MKALYRKVEKGNVVFLVLYVDDILLIGNSKIMLSSVRIWLSNQFEMKDIGEAGHILGIKVLRDCERECCACLKNLTSNCT